MTFKEQCERLQNFMNLTKGYRLKLFCKTLQKFILNNQLLNTQDSSLEQKVKHILYERLQNFKPFYLIFK